MIFTVIVTTPNDDGILPTLMGFAATTVLLWRRTRLPAVVASVGLLSVAALVFYPITVPGCSCTGRAGRDPTEPAAAETWSLLTGSCPRSHRANAPADRRNSPKVHG